MEDEYIQHKSWNVVDDVIIFPSLSVDDRTKWLCLNKKRINKRFQWPTHQKY